MLPTTSVLEMMLTEIVLIVYFVYFSKCYAFTPI